MDVTPAQRELVVVAQHHYGQHEVLLELSSNLLTNPGREWQLDGIYGAVLAPTNTFIVTMGRWLEWGMSKHRLKLSTKLLTSP